MKHSKVSIICISNGSVSWKFKEFNTAYFVELKNPEVTEYEGSLKLHNVKIKDTGVYQCKGFLSNGKKFFAESTLYVAGMMVLNLG